MDTITSFVVWGLCLSIGGPIALVGLFHFLAPQRAWSVYRGWGKRWGADPQQVAPDYRSVSAMRVTGVTLLLGGIAISLTPKLLGH